MPGFGDQRKSFGGKALSDGIDIQPKQIQISDLDQANGIPIDKNKSFVFLPSSKVRLSSSTRCNIFGVCFY